MRDDERKESIYDIVALDMDRLFDGWNMLVDSGKAYDSEVYSAIADQYGHDLACDWQRLYKDRL